MVSIPKGTRDFGPEQMARRQRVFDVIRAQFRLFGFQPLETPAMENLSVLTGKYGEEGDRLIYKILNSGNYLDGVSEEEMKGSTAALAAKICDRALRYDLTVPFARYVAMNKGRLTMPFRRYQMQPVWRADRPQKGRYREFWQCDADIVGTNSLVCEGELLALLYGVFSALGLGERVRIKLNSRKLLAGISKAIGIENKLVEFTTAIDKLDKIGINNVIVELKAREFTEEQIKEIASFLVHNDETSFIQKIYQYTKWFSKTNNLIEEGLADLVKIHGLAHNQGVPYANLEFDPTLARGLDYYTGAIIEVKALGVSIGSIAGGGRYDNLTAVFGVPDVPGVGVSFGIDRICDVLDELNLNGDVRATTTQVLVCSQDEDGLSHAAETVSILRKSKIAAEIYPDAAKLKRQLSYADKMGIGIAIILGPDEREAKTATVRELATSTQILIPIAELSSTLKNRFNVREFG